MKKKIVKFKLEGRVAGDKITMPVGSGILSIQTIAGVPFLWAYVNDKETNTIERTFYSMGEGKEMDAAEYYYVGSYQRFNGRFTSHVFESSERQFNK